MIDYFTASAWITGENTNVTFTFAKLSQTTGYVFRVRDGAIVDQVTVRTDDEKPVISATFETDWNGLRGAQTGTCGSDGNITWDPATTEIWRPKPGTVAPPRTAKP